jgi:TolB-like protein/class 3 adenylate cyclase/tetratricopeptide (TPR) repeat protein
MAPRTDRKLAAILAADVVGYSWLVGDDEAGTIARLRALRKELLEPLVAEYHGRVVKLMGDGALVEFASAVDAVECAVAVQRGVAEREAAVPPERRIAFRIGINVGDIIVEDGDILGDGVNIAARLEGLAEPGGVCTARNVYNQVKDKVELAFEPMGQHRVKNIAEPITVYRVLPGRAKRRPASMASALRGRGTVGIAVAVMLVLAVGAAAIWYTFSLPVSEPPVSTAAGSGERPALPLPDRPSIAILPFENLSGDPRWERFVGGITEDIITDLARHPDLFVIAHNSTEAYKAKGVDVRQVGRDLGVRYVLEGSVQADAGRVRVTAQLIDAATRGHLWAARYDQPEGELFAIQDEVVQKIANSVGEWHGQVARARLLVAKRKPPASLDSYDLYLLGIEQKHKFTKESEAEAIQLLARAVELDPDFARAWVGLAMAHFINASYGYSDDPPADMKRFRECIERALTLDPTEPMALIMMGDIRATRGDVTGANEEYERALAAAPGDAEMLALLSTEALGTMEPERAAAFGRQALRLNPSAPNYYFLFLAYAEYARGAYREAIALLRQIPMDSPPPILFLALAHAQAGETEEAKHLAARLQTEFPSFTLDDFIRDYAVTSPAAIDLIREGATKAGLLPIATH